MDPSLDDFINYDHNTEPLRVDFPDFNFSFPENNVPDLFHNVPTYMPKTIQNILDQEPNNNPNGLFFNFGEVQAASTQYAETDKGQIKTLFENYTSVEQTDASYSPNNSYSPNSPDDNESTLNAGSKKITKREKAKIKAKAKQEALNAMLETVDKKYIPEEFYSPDVDEETKKKMIQVIRNRVSAQSSRDKKKQQAQLLEEARSKLEDQNNELRRQNQILAQKLKNSEAKCKSLSEQLEAFKRAETPCLKCAIPSEFGPSDTTDTQEASEETNSTSNGSSPLYRGAGGARGNFFGFGVAFTTMMCVLMFMGTNMNPLENRGIMNLFANLNGIFGGGDEQGNETEHRERQVDLETSSYREVDFGMDGEKYLDFPILQQLKPLVDRFDAHHKDLYKRYEKNQVVVDLANSKFENRPFKITDYKKTKFLGKNNATKTQNHTSTLVISSGYEVQKNESNKPLDMRIQEEVVEDNCMSQKETSPTPLGLEKADFVQLFVPKSALGQLGGAHNIKEETLPVLEEGSADSSDTLLEVWCKIFAIREMSPTL